jgi:FtsZ-binding cell division protein ZapB
VSAGEIVAVLAAITALIGAFATLRKNRSDNQAALATISAEHEAAQAAIARERESLKSDTDKRIDERLKEELGRAYDRIDQMQGEIDSLKEEPNAIKAVVRRWIFSLHEWGRAGGHDVPWPNDADMAILAPEFVDLANTMPGDRARRLRDGID